MAILQRPVVPRPVGDVFHRDDRERAEHLLDGSGRAAGDVGARAPSTAEELKGADEAGDDRAADDQEPASAVPRLVRRIRGQQVRTGPGR